MPRTITIRLPEKPKERFGKDCENGKTSKSDVIRDALEHYVALKRFQQRRKKALPFAELKA
jgi:metal-responsive CopG/Arc/MetJ family transcriptional regulator